MSRFQVTLDMVEMVLAKADPRITELYDNELLDDEELKAFGAMLRNLFEETEDMLLQAQTLSPASANIVACGNFHNDWFSSCTKIFSSELSKS